MKRTKRVSSICWIPRKTTEPGSSKHAADLCKSSLTMGIRVGNLSSYRSRPLIGPSWRCWKPFPQRRSSGRLSRRRAFVDAGLGGSALLGWLRDGEWCRAGQQDDDRDAPLGKEEQSRPSAPCCSFGHGRLSTTQSSSGSGEQTLEFFLDLTVAFAGIA